MNKQAKRNRDGSIRSRGIEWTDYTHNPLGGCFHDCKWTMPDGKEASCYAGAVAGGVAGNAYPQGFEHLYWKPETLNRPLGQKAPSRIFLGSMTDVFGARVPDEYIREILEMCRKAHWHTFQILTKNAPRLEAFDIPVNVWIGASSPPDFMFGRALTQQQQARMLERTLKTLARVSVPVRWISFEPLSWDVSEIVARYPGAIQWAVIGAASNGRQEFPPAPDHFIRLLEVLDAQGVKVFYKGNLRSLPEAAAAWREDFPLITVEAEQG